MTEGERGERDRNGINWIEVRRGWRKKGERFATERYPEKCTCGDGGGWQCGEPCLWCMKVEDYMQAMEAHSDVILSRAKECSF